MSFAQRFGFGGVPVVNPPPLLMTSQPNHDRVLQCTDCNNPFQFSVSEQAKFAESNWSDPIRCLACRKLRKEKVAKRREESVGGGEDLTPEEESERKIKEIDVPQAKYENFRFVLQERTLDLDALVRYLPWGFCIDRWLGNAVKLTYRLEVSVEFTESDAGVEGTEDRRPIEFRHHELVAGKFETVNVRITNIPTFRLRSQPTSFVSKYLLRMSECVDYNIQGLIEQQDMVASLADELLRQGCLIQNRLIASGPVWKSKIDFLRNTYACSIATPAGANANSLLNRFCSMNCSADIEPQSRLPSVVLAEVYQQMAKKSLRDSSLPGFLAGLQ